MPLPAQSAARAALRAVLLGAGVVGGYLLLSLLAGPANADSGPIGGGLGDVADTGIDVGGLVEDLPVPDLGQPEAPAAPANPAPVRPEPAPEVEPEPAVEPAPEPAPAAEPEPAPAAGPERAAENSPEPAAEPDQEPPTGASERPRVDHGPVGDLVAPAAREAVDLTEQAAGTTPSLTGDLTALAQPVVGPILEPTGESLDQLVTGLVGTVESTISPLAPAVGGLLPEPVPVVEEIAEAATNPPPPAPPPVSLTGPIAPIVEPLVPSAPATATTQSTLSTGLPGARDGPDPPGDRPVPLGPPLQPASWDAVPGGQPTAVPAAAAGFTGSEHEEPRPTRLPHRPIPSTHQAAGQSFDPGQPWPSTGPSHTTAEPELSLLRSLDDIAYTGLVMSISAPPG